MGSIALAFVEVLFVRMGWHTSYLPPLDRVPVAGVEFSLGVVELFRLVESNQGGVFYNGGVKPNLLLSCYLVLVTREQFATTRARRQEDGRTAEKNCF